ncbi:hypothetical protein LSAT2_032246 [Lamellibrachia satsuma]|nr:hypothetical protein LSAT2_032246 [Lamellibrachia satsuma]
MFTLIQRATIFTSNDNDDCVTMCRGVTTHRPMTFNSLMQRRRTPDDKADYVYMVIGELAATQEFNLIGILQSSEEKKRSTSSLILVSNGARVLRIRRDLYMKSLNDDDVSLAALQAACCQPDGAAYKAAEIAKAIGPTVFDNEESTTPKPATPSCTGR